METTTFIWFVWCSVPGWVQGWEDRVHKGHPAPAWCWQLYILDWDCKFDKLYRTLQTVYRKLQGSPLQLMKNKTHVCITSWVRLPYHHWDVEDDIMSNLTQEFTLSMWCYQYQMSGIFHFMASHVKTCSRTTITMIVSCLLCRTSMEEGPHWITDTRDCWILMSGMGAEHYSLLFSRQATSWIQTMQIWKY